jgi:beta-galactosidase
LDLSQKGKKVFLEFEGIRQAGVFYLNGKKIGISENGIMAFGFDISESVLYGQDNVLAVRIDNSWNYHEIATKSGFQWNDKNFYANYGGINKNAYLYVMDKLYQTMPLYSSFKTSGVYIFANDFEIESGTANVHIQSEVRNEYPGTKNMELSVNIIDNQTGKLVSSFSGVNTLLQANETQIVTANQKIKGLHFWSWGYGYLYQVQTIVKVNGVIIDQVETLTGFRKTNFENGMLSLNNRPIQIKGYAQRTTNEWPAIGLSVPAWLSDYSNRLMVQGNANLVRWMHVTPWKQDVESCDRVGLMQAMPAGDSEKDVDGRRWEQRLEVMRDAIVYNRNNPSIIFYECGNKGISESHMKEMLSIRNQFDSNGGRAMGSREMLDSKNAEYGGEMLYINKSATKPLWQMEYSRDEGLRKYWDEYTPPYHKEGAGPLYKGEDARIYNHNQDAHAIENVVRWYDYWKERPGTGKRVNAGGVNIIFSESNTHYRGAENYRRSGEVDALRIPKDGYYAHKVIWNGWVDSEQPALHILGHWNYTVGIVKDITVISNTSKVELFVNGKSLGYGTRSHQFLFQFKQVKWVPGQIKAIGYDEKNNPVCSMEHSTAGTPYAIRLKNISSVDLHANGADLALVEFEVIDQKGKRCPTALNEINFKLNGPAQWRGGMAQGPDNYILSKVLPVECGVNRVLIRSLNTPGRINLQASSPGLISANLTIDSKPIIMHDGLAMELPSKGLKSHLEKGPTPQSPSFKNSRTAIPILQTKAGSNSVNAAMSYDDNEKTDWSNDGKLETAWIEYDLGLEQTVNELVVKFNNFRTKSYPLVISLDGKEIFRGNSALGLGYTSFEFANAKGRRIKIALSGNSQVTGEEHIEVNGKKLDDGIPSVEKNTAGKLSIIELELYKK